MSGEFQYYPWPNNQLNPILRGFDLDVLKQKQMSLGSKGNKNLNDFKRKISKYFLTNKENVVR